MRLSEIDVSDPGLSTGNLVEPAGAKGKKRPAPVAGTKALDIFWDRRIREVGKIARPSPLFPKADVARESRRSTGCRRAI